MITRRIGWTMLICAGFLFVVFLFWLHPCLLLPPFPDVPEPRKVALPSGRMLPSRPACLPADAGQKVSAEEEWVFIEAVLRSEFEQAAESGAVFLIQSPFSIRRLFTNEPRTGLLYELINSGRAADTALAEAIHDLADKNAADTRIEPGENMSLKLDIIPESLIDRLFQQEDEAGDPLLSLYARHPDCTGVVCLSRPGFSCDRTVGIIFMGAVGAGPNAIKVFRKRNGRWESTDERIGPSLTVDVF